MGYGVDKNNKKLNKLTDYLFLKKYFCNLYWIIVHVTAVLQVSSTWESSKLSHVINTKKVNYLLPSPTQRLHSTMNKMNPVFFGEDPQ